jgi:hypothetical protein
MKKYLFVITIYLFTAFINLDAQNVNIPDANFKAYLVGNAAINTNSDAEIQVTEANAYTGIINCNSLGISDLTGISAFTSATQLFCSSNSLTSLNISSNTALTVLVCSANQLSSLNLSSNTALTYINCANNQLSTLDISNNTALDYLSCYSNDITSLDVSANTVLTSLACSENLLTSLDVSANPLLVLLYCNNQLLTYLNVNNGNNINITAFNATGNPNLTCIQVDSVEYSIANWGALVDSTANFSEYCSPAGNQAYDSYPSLTVYPNPAAQVIHIDAEVELNTTCYVTDLTGKIVYTGYLLGNHTLFNIDHLTPGVYFLQINQPGSVPIKFIKN